MPTKNPWGYDTVPLNNRGLDLIHPIEQVSHDHYSRMEDVKSLQEGTLTPRPGTSLVNSISFATGAAATSVSSGLTEIPRQHGDGSNNNGYTTNSPFLQWSSGHLYVLVISAKSLAGGTTDVTVTSVTGGVGMTWTEIGVAHFNTVANPNAILSVWTGMRASGSNSAQLGVNFNVTVDTGLFSVQAFTGIDVTGGDGAAAVSNVTVFTSDGTAAPSITLAASAAQNSTWAGFSAREVGTITKGSAFGYVAPFGAGHYMAEWVQTMQLAANATVDTSRAIGGVAFHIVGA